MPPGEVALLDNAGELKLQSRYGHPLLINDKK